MEAVANQRAGPEEATAPAAPTAADRELAIRLGAVMLHVLGSGGGDVVRAIDESGLAFTQMKALVSISGDEEMHPCSVKHVADEIGLSLPSASRAIEGLVKRGLATRTEDPDDRRVRRVSLTPSGRELADRLLAARISGLERFAASLSPTQRRKLDSALEALLGSDEIAAVYRKHERKVPR